MAASVALRKVPATHAAGICTTLPFGQLKLAAHSTHAVALAASWYLPSAHAVQSWLLALAANVPALHSVAEVAPAKQKLPAGQAWQLGSRPPLPYSKNAPKVQLHNVRLTSPGRPAAEVVTQAAPQSVWEKAEAW